MIPQQGGRLLGEGSYGCIFTPPLVCRGDKEPRGGLNKGKLGKLTDKDDIKSEIGFAALFNNKPEAKKYFVLPEIPTLCVPAPIAEQSEKKAIGECHPVDQYGYDKMLHYEVEYGGKTLHSTMENVSFIIKDFSFSTFMRYMLEIGAYMALNGCIHNDLHSNNVLLNKEYHPRLIDFGRAYFAKSITKETIDNLGADYAPSLGQIPPEVTLQDGMAESIPFNRMIDDLKTKKSAFKRAEHLLGVSRDQEMMEFRQFWKTSKAVQQENWLTFWKLYWPVVDSWSIGGLLIGILEKLHFTRQFVEGEDWNKHKAVIKTILKGLLKASPRARLDCVEALALYDPMNSVVLSPSGKAWLQQKKR